jgi:AcrR family transcriptional regulator
MVEQQVEPVKSKVGNAPDTVKTKERIRDAAIVLFAKKGFEAVSIREIAESVGITKSSIYSHFRSKDEILQSILSFFIQEIGKKSTKSVEEEKFILGILDTIGPAGLMATVETQFDERLRVPRMQMIWRMITIEMCRNAMIRSFVERELFEKPVNFWEKAFRIMAGKGMIKARDPLGLAREYHAFNIYLYMKYSLLACDEDYEQLRPRVLKESETHILMFLEANKA